MLSLCPNLSGYSVVRSLSEAPKYAAAIANIMRQDQTTAMLVHKKVHENISMQGIVMVSQFYSMSLDVRHLFGFLRLYFV